MAERHRKSGDDARWRQRRLVEFATDEPLAEQDEAADGDYGDGMAYDHVNELSAVAADDELLDALGGADPAVSGMAEDKLNALLLAWRLDVDAEPMGDVVDIETAANAVSQGRRPAHRFRLLVPLTSAAAVLAIAFATVVVAAHAAKPGDVLWGLTRVLYSDHANSVEAAASVRAELDKASDALQKGHIADAQTALSKANAVLPSVAVEDGRPALHATKEKLLLELSTTTPSTSTTPSTPSLTYTTPLSSASAVATPPSSSTSPTPSTTTTPLPSTSTTPPTSGSVPPRTTTPATPSVGGSTTGARSASGLLDPPPTSAVR